jgi:hypothetical protein
MSTYALFLQKPNVSNLKLLFADLSGGVKGKDDHNIRIHSIKFAKWDANWIGLLAPVTCAMEQIAYMSKVNSKCHHCASSWMCDTEAFAMTLM